MLVRCCAATPCHKPSALKWLSGVASVSFSMRQFSPSFAAASTSRPSFLPCTTRLSATMSSPGNSLGGASSASLPGWAQER